MNWKFWRRKKKEMQFKVLNVKYVLERLYDIEAPPIPEFKVVAFGNAESEACFITGEKEV